MYIDGTEEASLELNVGILSIKNGPMPIPSGLAAVISREGGRDLIQWFKVCFVNN